MSKEKAPAKLRKPLVNRVIGSGIERVDQLAANPNNWRIHPDPQQQALAGAIDDIGFVRSVTVNKRTGNVVDGHARIVIAMRSGVTELPVEYVDLSEEDEAKALLTLDPIATLAAADRDKLDELLRQVQSDDERVQQMLSDLAEREGLDYGAEPKPDPGAQIDKAEELTVKWGVELGQLWQVGKHRIICGDCTDRAVVERLMESRRAILFATDPPYGANAGNIGFTAQRDDIEAITKDDLEGREMQDFLEMAFRAWIPSLESNAAWYLWHPMLTQGYFAAAAAAADLIIHRQIIWRKEQFIFGRGDYHWRHELCFYGWRKGNRPPFYGERNQDTVWDIPWGEKRSETGHPTAKPPRLFEIPMENHTHVGEICAEPFSGSGSQMVAGERLGRCVYAAELEPKFVAVSLERLSQMGLTPELVE